MLLEKDVDVDFSDQTGEKKYFLMMIPEIYKYYRNYCFFSFKKLFYYIAFGVFHSLIIFFVPLVMLFQSVIDNTGRVIY